MGASYKSPINIRKSPNLLLRKPKATSYGTIAEQPWQKLRAVPELHWLLVQARSMLIKRTYVINAFEDLTNYCSVRFIISSLSPDLRGGCVL